MDPDSVEDPLEKDEDVWEDEEEEEESSDEEDGMYLVEDYGDETQLTKALEGKDYAKALQLVRDNEGNVELLNEGYMERKPLFIVLCGFDENYTSRPVHLQLAQALVSSGADPSWRSENDWYPERPQFDPNADFEDDSEQLSYSPIELLLNFYVSCRWMWANENPNLWKKRQLLFGTCGRPGEELEFDEFRKQVLDLVQLFLSKGGVEPLKQGYPHRHPVLHRILKHAPDVDLIDCLVSFGASTTIKDYFGNTCFHSLVNVHRHELDAINRQKLLKLLIESHDVIQISAKSPFLETENSYSHSALYQAMIWQHLDLVQPLIAAGAKVDVSSDRPEMVTCMCKTDVHAPKTLVKVPLFLAPLFPPENSDTRKMSYIQKVEWGEAGQRMLSRLVDSGCLQKQGYLLKKSLVSVIPWSDYFGPHVDLVENAHETVLINDLFGKSCASLKQLCVRVIFEESVLKARSPHDLLRNKGSNNLMGAVGGSSVVRMSKAAKRKRKRTNRKKKSANGASQGHSKSGVENCMRCSIESSVTLDVSHYFVSKKQNCTHPQLQEWTQQEVTFLLDALNLPNAYLRLFELELFRAKLLLYMTGFSHRHSDPELNDDDFEDDYTYEEEYWASDFDSDVYDSDFHTDFGSLNMDEFLFDYQLNDYLGTTFLQEALDSDLDSDG